jgi:8-oxo-dGTP diphosphatase
VRVIKDKTGIGANSLNLFTEQLYTFDTPGLSGGNTISLVYLSLCRDVTPHSGRFFSVDNLPELAYAHEEIIVYARERLRSKILYTNVLFALLPAQFTFSQLQQGYEAILDQSFDKRNFRKKFMQLGLIEPIDAKHREGAHRPARLFVFSRQALQTLSRNLN